MRKVSGMLLWVAALAVLAFLSFQQGQKQAPAAVVSGADAIYDRILKTRHLRCGYMIWPPTFMRDPNTGAFSGIGYDYFMALGEATGLQIDWVYEMNIATYIEDLKAGKFDVECSGGYPNAKRGLALDYTTPIFYFGIYPIVRADDARFDNNYQAINDETVRVTTPDGDTGSRIWQTRFPKAQNIGLPQTASYTDLLLNVVTNKADVVFLERQVFETFNKENPNKLKIAKGPALVVLPFNASLPGDSTRLQQMLNTATQELLYNGVIDKIIDKYEPVRGSYLRVAPPYHAVGE